MTNTSPSTSQTVKSLLSGWRVYALITILTLILIGYHVPHVLILDPIAPMDLIFAHPPWTSVRPEDLIVGSYIPSDQFDYLHPSYVYIVESIREGDLPAYTSLSGNGIPYYFSMTNYAPNHLIISLGLLFGPGPGYTIYKLLLISLAAMAFYSFLLKKNLHPLSALYAVMLLVISSTSLTALGIPMSDQMFYTAMGLWALNRCISQPNVYSSVLLAVIIYFLLVSGYPPGTVTLLLFLSFYTLYELYEKWRLQNLGLKHFSALVTASVICITLALPFLIEAYNQFLSNEALGIETRSSTYPKWSLNPISYVLGFTPTIMGDALTNVHGPGKTRWFFDQNYAGLVTIFLSCFAIAAIGHKRGATFFCILFVFLTLTIFNYWNLNASLLGKLPIFSTVRAYTHLYSWLLSLAIVSAYGLDAILNRKRKPITLVCISIFAITLPTTILFRILSLNPSASEVVQNSLPRLLSIQQLLPLLLILFVLGTQCVKIDIYRQRLLAQFFTLGVLVFTAIDILVVNQGINRTTPKEYYFPQTAAVDFLKDNQGDGKTLPLDNSLLASAHLPYGVRSLGYRGFFKPKVRNVFAAFSPNLSLNGITTQHLFRLDKGLKLDHPFLDLMGLKYVTTLPHKTLPTPNQTRHLLPRNPKENYNIFANEIVTQYLYTPSAINFDTLRILFVDLPDDAKFSLELGKETAEENTISSLKKISISAADLSAKQGEYLDWTLHLEEPVSLGAGDRLILKIRNSDTPITVATYSERHARDWLWRSTEKPKISSWATDLFITQQEGSNRRFPRFRLVFNEGMNIYENLDYKGRAFVPTQCREISDDKILDVIQEELPNLSHTVLRAECPSSQGEGKVEIVNESEGEMLLRAEMSSAGTIVIGDNYNPDWVATANGENLPVSKVNYNFFAIDVPAGVTDIKFHYGSKALFLAFYLSLLIWGAIIIFFILNLLKKSNLLRRRMFHLQTKPIHD